MASLIYGQILDMTETRGWEPRRYVTLFLVLVFHLALLLVFVKTTTIGGISAVERPPVQLLVLPPAAIPKIRSENFRPHRFDGNEGISIAPPSLDYSTSQASNPSGSNGNGEGVDWAAEARRALKAYEIRNNKHGTSNASSGPPIDDEWWPQAQHHAGEQYKTDTGDWIVWINSGCYQVATSASSLNNPGAVMPQTICPGKSGASRGDLLKDLPAYQKAHPDE
jgi:hypothetical protein